MGITEKVDGGVGIIQFLLELRIYFKKQKQHVSNFSFKIFSFRDVFEIQNERKWKAMGHRHVLSRGPTFFSQNDTFFPKKDDSFRAFLSRALNEPVIIYPTP